MTEVPRDEMIEKMARYMKVSEIADEFGLTRQRVYQILKERGVSPPTLREAEEVAP